METQKFIYYQDDAMWVGWLEDYPDYRTQGSTLEELKENLSDVYRDVNSGTIPHVRKRGELVVSLSACSEASRDSRYSRQAHNQDAERMMRRSSARQAQ